MVVHRRDSFHGNVTSTFQLLEQFVTPIYICMYMQYIATYQPLLGKKSKQKLHLANVINDMFVCLACAKGFCIYLFFGITQTVL